MNNEINFMSVKEFREKGYLQELNRQFLHPLGLAISVEINNDTGEETFGGIWDSRDDPMGFYYDLKNSSVDRIEAFTKKAEIISKEKNKFTEERLKVLGDIIEPIPEL